MLKIIEKGKVIHAPAEAAISKMDARRALAILAGIVVTKGSLSERSAYRDIEKYLRTTSGPEAA